MLGKGLSGCGCCIMVLFVTVAAFFAGAKYGQKVRLELAERGSKMIAQARLGIETIDKNIKVAQAAADSLVEPANPPTSDKKVSK